MFKRYILPVLVIVNCLVSVRSYNQCPDKEEIYKKILVIDKDEFQSGIQKLDAIYKLIKIAEQCNIENDSVYAWLFLKLGKYEFAGKKNYENTIKFTQEAIRINNTSVKGSSRLLTINAYFNLASSYEALLFYNRALSYYDSVIFLCKSHIDTSDFELDSRVHKTNIYFSSGDYQKAIEESIRGMRLSETQNNIYQYLSFMNMKAQSICFQNGMQQNLPEAYEAVTMAKKINNKEELATAYKTLALFHEKKHLADSSKYYFDQAIHTRLQTGDYVNICGDYNDFGSFYLNELHDFKNSEIAYKKIFSYADRIDDPVARAISKALAYLNLGENYFEQDKLPETELNYLKAFNTLQLNLDDITKNPLAAKIVNLSSNADLVIVLMNNKTKLLFKKFKQTHKAEYLDACMRTALVTDSVITQIQHEHSSEQSKLFWRNKTRQFYANSIEAASLLNDPSLTFYFMEKSRAALLNDKLNELQASKQLLIQDAVTEENYQIKIVELQQQLSALSDTSKQYRDVELELITVKDNFERYTKSLEQKYPAYYQYKYDDKVPLLKNLQQYLAKANQSFVYYFTSDTAMHILAITSKFTKFIRLSYKNEMDLFLQLCSNKQALNNNYHTFIELSNSIYKKIFQPLQLPKGPVIICADNIVIPFDALFTDTAGKKFLLEDHSFSYVYSARSLMNQFKNSIANGNFLGFAPVSFANYLGVNELKDAGDALYASAGYYSNNKVFTHKDATRNNFFKHVSSYLVVNIFSHASADTAGDEPILFMQDSAIHLSELQLLNNPATQLVLLSACQTNVGKAATGEGIYSLARGFATAGIPSVIATLWKADEQAIYAISEKFNEYLSQGMNKDEALQKAKLYFIDNNSSEKALPYYWANMILIGNTHAINLTTANNNYWWWIAGFCFILLSLLVAWKKKFLKNKEIKIY